MEKISIALLCSLQQIEHIHLIFLNELLSNGVLIITLFLINVTNHPFFIIAEQILIFDNFVWFVHALFLFCILRQKVGIAGDTTLPIVFSLSVEATRSVFVPPKVVFTFTITPLSLFGKLTDYFFSFLLNHHKSQKGMGL